jgi:small-conductance mechanosensitive channel
VFLAFVLVDSLPLQLLNPAWPLRFTNRMINTSLLALLGFLLLHLGLFIEPANGFLRVQLATARQWAIVVVVAFLLLVPLQGFATWRVLSQAQGTQAMQRHVLGERVTMIRQAIEAATSPRRPPGPVLPNPGPPPPAACGGPQPPPRRAEAQPAR